MKPISNSDIDKTIRLIEYLQKIAITKSRICREINDYSHVLWLGEIPKEKGCFTQAWGSNQEYDEDIWIEINLTHEPEFPDPPSICLKWIDRQSIKNANKKPVLLNSIFEKTKNSIYGTKNNVLNDLWQKLAEREIYPIN